MRLPETTPSSAGLHTDRAPHSGQNTLIKAAVAEHMSQHSERPTSSTTIHSLKNRLATRVSAMVLALACWLTLSTTVTAAASFNVDELISLYEQTIAKLERSIGSAKAHRTALIEQMDALGNNLKHVETAAVKTNVKNPSLQRELDQLKLDLGEIESVLEQKRADLKQQQEHASGLPVPAVMSDALADETALQHHRELALWQYRLHLKKRKIAAIASQREALLGTIDKTTSRNDAIRHSMQKLTAQRESLNSERQTLEERFANLSVDIVRKQDRIERMNARKRRLVNNSAKTLDFSKVRGSLPDPIAGNLFKRFNEPKAEGLLQWEGILVKAQLGQEIEAVFDGKVVFVGEIQGLGKVAIIDHDQEYMSLYGMAELLVVEESQTVIAGQVIGTVGESAGIGASALYFEVRHNAKTVDPEEWLSMQSITSDPVE